MGPREVQSAFSGVAMPGILDHLPLVWTPSDPRCEAIVIVPARNEAETIQSTLRALAYQYDARGRPLDHTRYEVLLLCNNSTDASAYLARQFAMQHPSFALQVIEVTLAPANANVGYARRLLMNEACRRLRALGRPRGVICSTDGDTCVTPTWLAATLDAVQRGADAVGGRIQTSVAARKAMPPALRDCYLLDVAYQYFAAELEAMLDPDPHDPWPRHHQHFGASFAITAVMYERIGGLPRVPVFEDIALYRTLMQVDARVRHTLAVCVITSARRTGRAEGGMAVTLAGWEALGAVPPPLRVDNLPFLEARFRARRQLRILWQEGQRGDACSNDATARIARACAVEPHWLTNALRRYESFGTLYEATIARCKEEGRHGGPSTLIDIAEAVVQLRMRLAPWRAARQQLLASYGCIRQPLPEVEAIGRRTLPNAMTETGPFPLLKERMDIIAGQDTLVDPWRPVDEKQVPTRYEMRRDTRPERPQIIQ